MSTKFAAISQFPSLEQCYIDCFAILLNDWYVIGKLYRISISGCSTSFADD